MLGVVKEGEGAMRTSINLAVACAVLGFLLRQQLGGAGGKDAHPLRLHLLHSRCLPPPRRLRPQLPDTTEARSTCSAAPLWGRQRHLAHASGLKMSLSMVGAQYDAHCPQHSSRVPGLGAISTIQLVKARTSEVA